MRRLHFRECGLYEASNLLLGDHLTEKSNTVKWVDVAMPHKMSCRLKVLQFSLKRKSTVVSEVPSAKKVSAESVTPGPSTSTVEDDDCVIKS